MKRRIIGQIEAYWSQLLFSMVVVIVIVFIVHPGDIIRKARFNNLTRDIEEYAKYTPEIKNVVWLGFDAYIVPQNGSWSGGYYLVLCTEMNVSNTIFVSTIVNANGVAKTLQRATYGPNVNIGEVVTNRASYEIWETVPFIKPSTYTSIKMDDENHRIMQKNAKLAEKWLRQILKDNSARVIAKKEKEESDWKAEWDKRAACDLAAEKAVAKEVQQQNDAIRAEIKGENQAMSVQF